MQALFDVSGKSVLITGGSRGIGAMIAEGFVRAGAHVVIVSRKADELAVQHTHLSTLGSCDAVQADLSSLDGIADLVTALESRQLGGLSVLVNNAGAAWGAPLAEYPESGWDKVLDLNLKSVFFLTQQLLPQLTRAANRADPARVINIASINGISNPRMPNYAYSASKAGLIQLTRHLAADLAHIPVNVNGIAPGYFPTRMMTAAAVGVDDLARDIPLGRAGQLEDAAGTAIFLAARASAWMTGHTLVLDGGMVAAAG